MQSDQHIYILLLIPINWEDVIKIVNPALACCMQINNSTSKRITYWCDVIWWKELMATFRCLKWHVVWYMWYSISQTNTHPSINFHWSYLAMPVVGNRRTVFPGREGGCQFLHALVAPQSNIIATRRRHIYYILYIIYGVNVKAICITYI